MKEENIRMHIDRLLHEIEDFRPQKIILLLPRRGRKCFQSYILKYLIESKFPNIKVHYVNPQSREREFSEKLRYILSC